MSIPTLNDTGALEESIRALQEMISNAKRLHEANTLSMDTLTKDCNYYTYEWPVRCEFDYQPYEEATHNYPGCDASATLTAAYLFGQDVTDIVTLDKTWVSDMEEQYLNDYRHEPDDGADYFMDEAYDRRMEEEE